MLEIRTRVRWRKGTMPHKVLENMRNNVQVDGRYSNYIMNIMSDKIRFIFLSSVGFNVSVTYLVKSLLDFIQDNWMRNINFR